MNEDFQKAVIALIISTIIGGVIKLYLDYKTKILEKLWEKRLNGYTEFVKLTSLFPQYPYYKSVTWADVFQLSIDFRDWYFQGYAIVVSGAFREKYFDLQKYISTQVSAERVNNKVKLEMHQIEDFRVRCSQIRTQIARELESRENPIWYWLKPSKKA